MKILLVVGKNYANQAEAVEPMYLEFHGPLLDLGHTLYHFDHIAISQQLGLDGCAERFLHCVRNAHYDLVLYQTAGRDYVPREAIREAGRYVPIVAWNSDDDWQWETYTRELSSYFTFMVTTYRHIYSANKKKVPNLRLSQWGCYDRFANKGIDKDIPFSFVGRIYGQRYHDCRFLREQSGLNIYGVGSRLVKLGIRPFRGCSRVPFLMGKAVGSYEQVSNIWCRSKVSYTPLVASSDARTLQIKGRVFQMGLSKTLMLCDDNQELVHYYEPWKEYVPFNSIQDCAEKARFYNKNEGERSFIAKNYFRRTMNEHLWQHRFKKLFKDIGII